ncbi:hypothetical protein [Lactococcus protaetiae]|uniref:Uncharacterized protein n=1 Tax=Lactococcus protaetiae TaxID=2592653 RepID=A0A514Z660_9LACT|nr:hypothetical protein [Lactococcus protaetiae]MCL2114232.1 hypothetical protein [Streptococcaceae bacterium]QDK70079.1 hypothetical protein FLP15_01440 [Lactococcus protaetiae]
MVGDNKVLKSKRIFSMGKIRLNKGDVAFLFFVLIYTIGSLFPYFTDAVQGAGNSNIFTILFVGIAYLRSQISLVAFIVLGMVFPFIKRNKKISRIISIILFMATLDLATLMILPMFLYSSAGLENAKIILKVASVGYWIPTIVSIIISVWAIFVAFTPKNKKHKDTVDL